MAQHTSDKAGSEFGNSAGGVLRTASTANRGVKAAKNGVKFLKKAGDANPAAMILKLKLLLIVGIIFGCILLFLFIFGCILTLFPVLTSNVVLHQSDTENLSADSTLNFVASDLSSQDVEEMTTKFEEGKTKINGVFISGRQAAIDDITDDIIANDYVVDSWNDDGATIEDETYIIFSSGYSASMGNALSENAFQYFMDTSAVNDMHNKMNALLSKENKLYPFGSMIYGADYVRDSSGKVIKRIVEETHYEGDPPEEVTVTTVHVDVNLYIANLADISQDAFGFDMLETYDPDGLKNKGTTDKDGNLTFENVDVQSSVSTTIIKSTISSKVFEHSSEIERAAKTYGISEYTNLIYAVMMQESGGYGTDPMQSEESGLPGSSIERGVNLLSQNLKKVGCTGPDDLDRICVALQGYNYGPAYCTWAIENYGGYSEKNAEEYSNKMAEKYGWSSYGDKLYVPHVLRYYQSSGTLTGENAATVSLLGSTGGTDETYYDMITEMSLAMGESLFGSEYWDTHNIYFLNFSGAPNGTIVEVANSQVRETSSGGFVKTNGMQYIRWYNSVAGTNFGSGTPWCAIFTSWCMATAGYGDDVMQPFASCRYGVSWFKSRNQWVNGKGYEPKAGDIIFFDWADDNGYHDGVSDHVGIVEMCDGSYVYTIEGNSSNSVARRKYSIYSNSVLGYGIPRYPSAEMDAEEVSEITSAEAA